MSFIGKAIGKLTGADDAADAARDAANIQSNAANAGIAETRAAREEARALLSPFVQAGTQALPAQLDLLGLNGPEKQQAAIAALQGSPQFTALRAQGEESILANASATGGLRGGNVQGALAQFSPALLSQLISEQYGRLGGLTTLGANAAVGTGTQAMQSGQNVASLLQQGGAAQAGGALAQGQVAQQGFGTLLQGIGAFAGLGGMSGIRKLF